LLEVNDLCGFTNQLRSLNDQVPTWGNAVAVLTAAIIGVFGTTGRKVRLRLPDSLGS